MTPGPSRVRMVFEIARWEFLRFFKPRDLLVTLVVLVLGGAAGSLVFRAIAGGDAGGATIGVVATEPTPATEGVVAPANGIGPVAGAGTDAGAGAVAEALTVLVAAPAGNTAPFVFVDLSVADAEAALAAGDVDALVRPIGDGAVELSAPEEPGWAPAFADLLTSSVVLIRLEREGLGPEAAERAVAPVRIEHTRVGSARGGGGAVTLMVVVMLFAIFTGTGLLFTVITGEKALRVTEVVVSAVSPQSWIDGKILGTSLYVLVYMLTYAVGLVLVIVAFGLAGGQLPALPPLVTDPVLFLVTLAFAAAGFGLWFTLFAAVAATINDPTTSARGSFIMLPGVAIAAGFLGLVGDADGPFFRVLGYLPFTSPSAMPVRMLVGNVAWWEVVLSLALLVACLPLVRRAAGRVFALGILMTGKEPTAGEIARWVRRA